MAISNSKAATMTGCLAVCIWGFALPVLRILQEQLGPLLTLGLVYGGACLLGFLRMFLSQGARIPLTAFRSRYSYLRFFFLACHLGFIFFALGRVSRENIPLVLLLNYFWPSALMLVALWLKSMRIYKKKLFAVGILLVFLSLAGELLGSSVLERNYFERREDVLAYVFAFLGAWSWGIYSALSRTYGEQSGGTTVLPVFQISVSALALIAYLLFPHWNSPAPHLEFELALLLAYCFAQFVAYLTWDIGVRKGSVVLLSLFADFIPWLSLLSAWILLDIPIGSTTVLSAAVLVLGALATRWATLEPKKIVEEV